MHGMSGEYPQMLSQETLPATSRRLRISNSLQCAEAPNECLTNLRAIYRRSLEYGGISLDVHGIPVGCHRVCVEYVWDIMDHRLYINATSWNIIDYLLNIKGFPMGYQWNAMECCGTSMDSNGMHVMSTEYP